MHAAVVVEKNVELAAEQLCTMDQEAKDGKAEDRTKSISSFFIELWVCKRLQLAKMGSSGIKCVPLPHRADDLLNSLNQSLEPGGIGEFAIFIAAAAALMVAVRKWLTR